MAARALRLALLAAYVLLWLGGVGVHLFSAAPRGAEWGAPAFLACAAVLVLMHAPGARAWLLVAGVAGWFAELVGSKTGWPFGPYSYTDALQPQIAGVPVAMVFAWLVLLGYVKSFEGAWPGGWRLRVLLGSLWMVAIDLAIEPVATGLLGFWRWHAPGFYFGVPALNFAGWFVVSATLLAGGRRAAPPAPAVRWIGLSVIAFFGVLGAVARHPAPPLVAVALAGLHWAANRRLSVRPRGCC